MYTRSRLRRRSSARRIKLTIYSILLLVLSFYGIKGYASLNTTPHTFISPLATTVDAKESIPQIVPSADLGQAVTHALDGSKGTYGVYIKNLKTGEIYIQSEHTKFASASLYKLWVMGAVYKKIAAGSLQENKQLHDSVSHLNTIFHLSSDSADLTEGDFDMSVTTALTQMITISHNYSALLLTSEVKNSNVLKFMQEYNFSESNLGDPPQTTPYDIGQYYERVYNGELIDRAYSDKMLDLLKKQQLNDRLPKYLPTSVEVAHKTGELDGFKHDAGIVYTEKGDYVIVLMSKSDDPQGAAEREALVSREVYTYFTK